MLSVTDIKPRIQMEKPVIISYHGDEFRMQYRAVKDRLSGKG